MVRLLNKDSVKPLTDIVTFLFNIQKHLTHIENVDMPDVGPCVYALWHKHQCSIYGLPNHSTTNIMVSRSKDGDVIAGAIENALGFKTVRGSKSKRGAVQATMQMIEALKLGEFGAIMVDGPRGPEKVVKDGVIKIAKLSGRPIVPMTWYSNNFNFINLPSWDKLEMPILDVRLINLYGEPIYVPQDGDEASDEQCRQKLKESLDYLDEIVQDKYNEVYKFGLWKKRK
ncbi:DUF374 domain-containing protein [bacterium]|nr:DUF374 domain-containing protein [bacterium]